MLKIRTPKTHKAKREFKKHAPKLIKNDKKLAQKRTESKPFFAFIGKDVESMGELKHLKEVLLGDSS